MASNDPRKSKAQRREEAREEALRLRAEQERRAKRRRTNIWVGSTLGVVVVAVLVVVIVALGNKPVDVNTPSTAVGSNGGIPVSAQGVGKVDPNVVTVAVYSDYMCPNCSAFESKHMANLDALVKSNDIEIEYHPISILDGASQGTKYSTRASNAAATVADADPEHFVAFHEALFTNQPAENSTGLSDDQIKQIAIGVGVPESVANTFTDGKFTTWVTQSTQDAAKQGYASTPTILFNGEEFKGNWNTSAFDTALNDAIAKNKASQSAAPTESATPTPTATVGK